MLEYLVQIPLAGIRVERWDTMGSPSPCLIDIGMRILDEQEKAIVRQLIRDPRESDNGIGELTGVNVRTVSRKRLRLEHRGLRVYFRNVDRSSDVAREYNSRHVYITNI